MGHRCRESLGAVFQPRRSRAKSRAPFLGQRGAVAFPAAGPTDANGGHTRWNGSESWSAAGVKQPAGLYETRRLNPGLHPEKGGINDEPR